MFSPKPRALASSMRIEERLAMLDAVPAVQPLRRWSSSLAARRSAVVPHFDPAEAGIEARVLILLEAPGPMTNAGNLRPGSGFISTDNNDPTAENAWRIRNEVGLHEGALHWNIVPWYLGVASRKPNVAEVAAGAEELLALLPLLPELRVVVLAGRHAQNGWTKHVARSSSLPVIETWHPSPQSLNQPGKRDQFREAIRSATAYL